MGRKSTEPLHIHARGNAHDANGKLNESTREDESERNTVAVIIPTFRRPEMLQTLLITLIDGSRVPDEVIVVDNDPDASANPAPIDGLNVQVVHAGLGISLSGARNVGWRSARSDICFFIDDDNVVDKDAVQELVDAFQLEDIGLAGPVVFAGDSNTIWCAGIKRSLWTGQTRCILGGDTDAPRDVIWETDDMPDAFAVPHTILEKLDGFDEKAFPIHYDEADFTARIRQLGFHNVVVGNARVRHYGWVAISPGRAMARAAASHGTDRVRQMVLSRVRFHAMHSGGLQRLSALMLFLPAWAALTALGCLRADAPWRLRVATARAVGSGLGAGYHETFTHQLESRGNAQAERAIRELDGPSSRERDWAALDGFFGALLPPVRMFLAKAARNLAFHSGLHRVLFYRYDYMFRPRELALLVSSLSDTHELPGPILEIGCAAGHTTVFLNKHLDDLADSREYVCLDTFAGFTDDDIATEAARGHQASRYAYVFRAYSKDWFDQTMRNNRVSRVTSVQADVNKFDFEPYKDISFCLIDVDLMRPVATALREIFPRMAEGGVIVVDDCTPNRKYDGAYEAYVEFIRQIRAPLDIRLGKLGVIQINGRTDEVKSNKSTKHASPTR